MIEPTQAGVRSLVERELWQRLSRFSPTLSREVEIPEIADAILSALTSAGDGWQDIATAPAAKGENDERVLAWGPKLGRRVEVVLPDGDWWRMRAAQGGGMLTHWRPLPAPPTPDADHAGGEG